MYVIFKPLMYVHMSAEKEAQRWEGEEKRGRERKG